MRYGTCALTLLRVAVRERVLRQFVTIVCDSKTRDLSRAISNMCMRVAVPSCVSQFVSSLMCIAVRDLSRAISNMCIHTFACGSSLMCIAVRDWYVRYDIHLSCV